MEKVTFKSAGIYADKLTEIYDKIVENKMDNGEKISQDESWNIESEIFQAYQTILANAKEGNTIAKSIEYLKHSVENTGAVANLNSLAISAVENAILENNRNNNNNIKTQENLVGVSVAAQIVGNESKKLDDIFNTTMLNALESELMRIRTGDKDAYTAMVTYENAAKELLKNDKLTEAQERAQLARMMRMAAIENSEPNQMLIIDYAEKYGFDVLENDSSGKRVVNNDKLTKLYQSKMPLNSKAKYFNIEDFKKINERIANKKKENGVQYNIETPMSVKEHVESTATQEILLNAIMSPNCSDEEFGNILKMYGEYSDSAKKALKQGVGICNVMQKRGIPENDVSKIQQRLLTLNDVMKIFDKEKIYNEKKFDSLNKYQIDEGRN